MRTPGLKAQVVRRCARRVLALLLMLALMGSAFVSNLQRVVRATDGDSTFGANGRAVVAFDASSEANDVALQPDGKIVLAGNYLNRGRTAGGIAIARLNTDGTLDTSFDGDGKVTTPAPASGFERAQAVVLQPDGKILVAGDGRGNTSQAGALYRFNADGTLDQTFGNGGRVFTEIPTPGVNLGALFNDVTLLPNNEIVAVGAASFQVGQPDSDIVVARYLPNGALNTSFGGFSGARPGTVVVNVGGLDTANAVAGISPGDNQILLAGSARNLGSIPSQFTDGFVTASLNLADGRPDANFGGGDGIEIVNFGQGSDAEANAIARLPGGNEFLLAGNRRRAGDLRLSAAVTYHHRNGSLNTNRGDNGVVFSLLAEETDDVALFPPGASLRALFASVTTPDPANPSDRDFSLLGSPLVNEALIDLAAKDDFNNRSSDAARAIALQPDGKVVLAGVTEVQGEQQMAVLRLGPLFPRIFFGTIRDSIIWQLDPVTGAMRVFTALPPASGDDVVVLSLAAEQTTDLATPGRLVALARKRVGSEQFLYLIQPDGTTSQLSLSESQLSEPVIDSDGNLFYTSIDPSESRTPRLRIRPGITGAPQTISTGSFANPGNLSIKPNGDVYVDAVDLGDGGSSQRVLLFLRRTGVDANGVPTFAAPEVAYRFSNSEIPKLIAFDRAGENIYFVPVGSGSVRQLIPVSGGPTYQLGPNSSGDLGFISEIAVTENGEVLVTDGGSPLPGFDSGAITRLNPDLTLIGRLTGPDIQNPSGITATQTLPPSADVRVIGRVSGITNPNIRYEFDLQNIGDASAENPRIIITVPPNVISPNLDTVPTGWTCTPLGSDGTFTCTNTNPLLPGAAAATFGLSVVAGGNGIFTSTATATTTAREPNQSNNTATASAAIGVEPALSVGDATVREGNSGTATAVVIVSLSAAVEGRPRFNIGTADGTATAPSDYMATPSVQVRLNPLETRRTFQFLVNGDTVIEPDEHFFVNITNAAGATISDGQGQVTILDDDAPTPTPTPTPTSTPTPSPTPAPTPTPTPSPLTVQFASSSFSVNEAAQVARINVMLSAPAPAPVRVDYETAPSVVIVPCATTNGTASERCDFTTALGKLHFAPGETTKSFDILITDDKYDDDGESFNIILSNPVGAALGPLSTAIVQISDDDDSNGPSPVRSASFNVEFFVRQHYADFLGRAPDPPGLAFWTGQATGCGATDPRVCRVNVSAAFFLSIEFQQTGYLVHRAHKASFGDLQGKPVPVVLRDFLADARRIGEGVVVGVGDWEARLGANTQAYFAEFVARPAFVNAHPPALTASEFVDGLFARAGVTPAQAERQAALAAFGAGGPSGRAAALRSVAESRTLGEAEFNRAFVLMQYYGYLRRNPDDAPDADFSGWQFWLAQLNRFNGNFVQAEMVRAFIESFEYGDRFGR